MPPRGAGCLGGSRSCEEARPGRTPRRRLPWGSLFPRGGAARAPTAGRRTAAPSETFGIPKRGAAPLRRRPQSRRIVRPGPRAAFTCGASPNSFFPALFPRQVAAQTRAQIKYTTSA
eukprot:13819192-Alexandrium_andersonii.AAC.1